MMHQTNQIVDFASLVGMTLTRISKMEDSEDGDALIFYADTGRVFFMYHMSDCCEHVYIESITGDLDDLIGSPITMAEESSNSDDPPLEKDWDDGSHTWTFYKLATIKGYVDIRWYGTSNGYYSENVDFIELEVTE